MRFEKALYTIGHSTHATDHFVGLLKRHGVTAVCDVRSHPYSKYNPQYNREKIADEIKSHGIAYIFLGKELGARSDNSNYYVDDKIQFKKLAADPLFQEGLARLKQGMKKYSIALMCAEKDPITCHRTILVTRQLQRDFTIKHILADGRLENNAETEKRLMNSLKIQPDLIRDEGQCIEDAYNLQGNKIAYTRENTSKKHLTYENHERY